MRKEINMETYKKRNQYQWFKNYPCSAYGFDVDIDVTKLVLLSKKRKESFFPYFFFAVMKGINAIDELRMRIVDGLPYLYDRIHPTFTVMTKENVYQNCGFEMKDDFREFYETTKEVIEEVKNLPVSDKLDRFPICETPNVVFATCIPVLDFTGHILFRSGIRNLYPFLESAGENTIRKKMEVTMLCSISQFLMSLWMAILLQLVSKPFRKSLTMSTIGENLW